MTVTPSQSDVPSERANDMNSKLKRHLSGRWFGIGLSVLACCSVVATYAAIRGTVSYTHLTLPTTPYV